MKRRGRNDKAHDAAINIAVGHQIQGAAGLLKQGPENNLIAHHEEYIANPLLKYINDRKDLNLIGKTQIKNKNRAPTIAFTSNSMTSKKFSDFLIKNKIATRNDNFYAWRCLKALGIDTKDGVVRTSMVHYNSEEDTNKLIEVLMKI